MPQDEEQEITRDEIKKEFQLERMILFSDAVFAIVITLMAIEIKIPEGEERLRGEALHHALIHLLPVVLAYLVSFMFIGAIWYQHLKIFALLKDYDKGLVVRNLVLLFFIGLFPFCASLVTRAQGAPGFFLYLLIILVCIIAQYSLYHYIVNKKPSLHINVDMTEHIEDLKKRRISVIGFSITAVLVVITYVLIPNPAMKTMSTCWMAVFGLVYRVMTKKKKVNYS